MHFSSPHSTTYPLDQNFTVYIMAYIIVTFIINNIYNKRQV